MALKIKTRFDGKENNDRIKLDFIFTLLWRLKSLFRCFLGRNNCDSLVYHPTISTRMCGGLYRSKLVKVGSPSVNVTGSEVAEKGIYWDLKGGAIQQSLSEALTLFLVRCGDRHGRWQAPACPHTPLVHGSALFPKYRTCWPTRAPGPVSDTWQETQRWYSRTM